MNTYDIGDTIRIRTTWETEAGVAVSPSVVTMIVKLPDGTTVEDTTAVEDAVGSFHNDFLTTQSGIHYYYVAGTGAVNEAVEGSFKVRRSNVISG